MSLRAFALRAEFEEGFGGASLAYGPDGHHFDVAKALAYGDGKIVTDDQTLILALEGLDGGDGPLLKNTTLGENYKVTPLPTTKGAIDQGLALNESQQATVQAGTLVDLEVEGISKASADEGESGGEGDPSVQHGDADEGYGGLTEKELKDELTARKIEFKKSAAKAELVALLDTDDDEKGSDA